MKLKPIAIQSDSAAYSVKLDSTANTFRTDSTYTMAADSAINTVKQDSSAKVPVKVEHYLIRLKRL
ncbi:hypothetical protein CS542_03125 [Pedobacter sp. IW39]|nr:hypothetical protein CS542_03125 [Pedobacter sp. IW39]